MDCAINKAVFLRSNGHMSCWCTAGAFHFLQRYDPGVDYCAEVYLGPIYERLRASLARGELPFPDTICPRCEHVSYDQPFDRAFGEQRSMACFHIEPSFACNLRCTGCTFDKRASLLEPTAAGHLNLDPAALDKIVGDFRRGGVRVGYFMAEGHGDALCNHRVWEIVEVVKTHYPDTPIWLGTNAQQRFDPARMTGTRLDEIRFAVDGAFPESYQRYRAGGELDKSLRFMRAFHAANPRTRTVWKYILFEHNDSPEEIRHAQELAQEMGLDALEFDLTTFGPVSHRYHRPEEIPVYVEGVEVKVRGSLWGMSVDNLLGALAEIEQGLATDDEAKVRSSAATVYTQLKKRFAWGADIDPGYHDVFLRFMHLARERLPGLFDLGPLEHILRHNRILGPRRP